MTRSMIAAAALLAIAEPAVAQDFQPSFDGASQNQQAIAQSQIGGHMVRQSMRRGSRGYARSRTAQTCANVPAVRRRLGASDSRVRRLTALCRQAGY